MALNGKIAAVTGAAMGIGKAITEILLQNGVKVKFWVFFAPVMKKSPFVHRYNIQFIFYFIFFTKPLLPT